MTIIDWYSVTFGVLQNLWEGFLNFTPALVGAILVFVVGWFISEGLGKIISEILKKMRFNQIFEKGVWKTALEKAEFKIDAAGFIGAIVKWIFVIVFLVAAVEILGLVEFAGFLKSVLAYLPNVAVASFIFVVAVVVADFSEKILRATVESISVGYGHITGVIVRWSIWVFAFLMILMQLGINTALIQTLFTGLVAMIALAGGIAFGLGGKDVAGEVVKDLYKKLKG